MSKLILAVEDQEDNMQILRDLLTSAGYEIVEAENGEQAIAAVAKRRPDLILMDIQLPIMDGYEATRRIKADPALRSIPIIAVTSHALSGGEEKARAAGCDDFVAKPYSPRVLLAKVRHYLSYSFRLFAAESPPMVGNVELRSSSSGASDASASNWRRRREGARLGAPWQDQPPYSSNGRRDICLAQ